jgi:hypothetical protein
MSLPRVLKPQAPVLFDQLIGEAQDILATELSWLTHIFGKSQKLVREREKKEYNYPGIFVDTKKYIDMLPTNEYGNFSFWIVEDPQNIDFRKNRFGTITANVGLVFWFDLSKIFPTSTDRGLEAVKAEILEVLSRKLFLNSGKFILTSIQEEAKNIYNEYSIKEIDLQFLMQPYCGLRFNGELSLKEGTLC